MKIDFKFCNNLQFFLELLELKNCKTAIDLYIYFFEIEKNNKKYFFR